MGTKLAGNEKLEFAVAVAMEAAADAMRDRRNKAYEAGSLSITDYEKLIEQELELRSKASSLVAKRLGAIIAEADQAQAGIEAAIIAAAARIAQIDALKRAIDIFAAVIVLSGALYTGNVPAIVAAAKSLADAMKTQKPAVASPGKTANPKLLKVAPARGRRPLKVNR